MGTFRRQRWLIVFRHLKELRRLLVIGYRTRFDSGFTINHETEEHAVRRRRSVAARAGRRVSCDAGRASLSGDRCESSACQDR